MHTGPGVHCLFNLKNIWPIYVQKKDDHDRISGYDRGNKLQGRLEKHADTKNENAKHLMDTYGTAECDRGAGTSDVGRELTQHHQVALYDLQSPTVEVVVCFR